MKIDSPPFSRHRIGLNRKMNIMSSVFMLFLLFTNSLGIAQEISAVVHFPTLGDVRVEAVSSQRYPGRPPVLIFETRDGEISKFEFLEGKEFSPDVLQEFAMPLRFISLSFKGLNTQIIIGSLGMQGGSDSTIETIIVGESEGKLQELLPKHLVTNLEDLICVGNFGPDNKLTVLVSKFIFDDAHPEPHKYLVTKYSWSGNHFSTEFNKTTKNKYRFGREALAEFGFICKGNLTELLVPDVY
jgi:hypothetical protein